MEKTIKKFLSITFPSTAWKKYTKLFAFLLSLILSNNLTAKVILIDPGHGGGELGASYTHHLSKDKKIHINEKDLSLKLAEQLKEELVRKKYTVYLTRSFDKKLDLNQRSKIAEKVKADIFISIHFNSSKDSSARGVETYFLSNKSNSAFKKIESVENFMEIPLDDITKKILIDLAVENTISSSKKLAKYVHQESMSNLKKKYKVKDRGVRSAMFFVLALSKRPGVLIEGGFISNKKEALLISQESYLKDYAKGISQGVDLYFKSLN